MAYVAISHALVNDMIAIINRLQRAEVYATSDVGEWHSKLSEAQKNSIIAGWVDKSWDDLLDLKERLTPYCVERNLTARVLLTSDEYKEGAPMTYELGAYQLRLPLPLTNKSVYTIDLTLADIPEDLREECKEVVFNFQEVVCRWTKVRNDVRTFLESCKSLNEAVKLWPDVRRYINKSYLTKLDAKTEAAKKKESAAMEMLKNMDIDAINASTVLARMNGAQI